MKKPPKKILNQIDQLKIHSTKDPNLQSSQIDKGEATTIILTNELEADFLITDDLRALSELQTLVNAKAAISPIVLKALVKRNVLTKKEALKMLEQAAKNRNWLKSPIYRKDKNLFK